MVKNTSAGRQSLTSPLSAQSHSTQPHSTWIPMSIVGTLFFIFGFATWLNGSLIPFLQIACELTHMQAYFVTMAFYIAYTITALPAATILKRTGYKHGMALGLLVMALGGGIFIPAAFLREYAVFLVGLFVLGAGLTLLQTAANPYIVHLGPHDSAAVRISLMGLMNKMAGVVAPIVFSALVFSDMSGYTEESLAVLSESDRQAALIELSQRLMMPYLVMSGLLIVLSVGVYFSPLPELNFLQGDEQENHSQASMRHNISVALRSPRLVLGVIALFFYVGVEVIAGDTIGLFGRELGVENFGQLTSYTMGFMVVGYVFGVLCIPRWISQETALLCSAIAGLILTICVLFSGNNTYVWPLLFAWTGITEIPDTVLFIALLGLANALVWPAIWPMALKGLGAYTSTGSALLIMAISGGAILPLIYGAIADLLHDTQLAYIVMLPGYAVILFYAIKGHNITQWRSSI